MTIIKDITKFANETSEAIQKAYEENVEGVAQGRPGGVPSPKNPEGGAALPGEIFRMADKTLGQAVDLALTNNGPSSLFGGINIPSNDSKPWRPVKVSDVDPQSSGLPEGTLKWFYSDGTQTLVVYEYPDGKKVTLPGDFQFPPLQEPSVCLGTGNRDLPVFETSDGHKFYKMPDGRLVEFHNNDVPVEILKAKFGGAGLEIVPDEKVTPRYERRPSFVRDMVPGEMRPLFESEYVMANDSSAKVWKIQPTGERKPFFVRRTEGSTYKILQLLEQNGFKQEVTINGTPTTEVQVRWDSQVGDWVETPAWAGTDRVVSTALYEARKLGRLSAIIDNLESDHQTVLTKDVDYLRGELRKKAWSEGEINDLVNVDDPAAQSRAWDQDLFSQAREDLARNRFNGTPDKSTAIESFRRTLVNMGVDEGKATKVAQEWYREIFEPATRRFEIPAGTPRIFNNQVNPGDPAQVTYLSDGDPLWVRSGNEEFGVSKGLTVVSAMEPIPQDRAQALSPDAFQNNPDLCMADDLLYAEGIPQAQATPPALLSSQKMDGPIEMYVKEDGTKLIRTSSGTEFYDKGNNLLRVGPPGEYDYFTGAPQAFTGNATNGVKFFFSQEVTKAYPKELLMNAAYLMVGMGLTYGIEETFQVDLGPGGRFVTSMAPVTISLAKGFAANVKTLVSEGVGLGFARAISAAKIAKDFGIGLIAGWTATQAMSALGADATTSGGFGLLAGLFSTTAPAAVGAVGSAAAVAAAAALAALLAGGAIGLAADKLSGGWFSDRMADGIEIEVNAVTSEKGELVVKSILPALGPTTFALPVVDALYTSHRYAMERKKIKDEMQAEDAQKIYEEKKQASREFQEALSSQAALVDKKGPAYDKTQEIVGMIEKYYADAPRDQNGDIKVDAREEFLDSLKAPGITWGSTNDWEAYQISVEDPQTHLKVVLTWNPKIGEAKVEEIIQQSQEPSLEERYGYGSYAVNLPKFHADGEKS